MAAQQYIMDPTIKSLLLFGGERSWQPADWVDSDDRVRGGKSRSYLSCDGLSSIAGFHGSLDITTLGGAGFASQRTTGDNRTWDVSGYDGLLLDIVYIDDKRYTITLKDTLLPKREDGRTQSTTSWEYDFSLKTESLVKNEGSDGHSLFIPWDSFKPTYRGRPDDKATSLDLTSIKRFSLLMRSFFGDQEGPFWLCIRSIAAGPAPANPSWSPCAALAEVGIAAKSADGVNRRDERSAPSRFGWSRPGLPRQSVVLVLLIGTAIFAFAGWFRSPVPSLTSDW